LRAANHARFARIHGWTGKYAVLALAGAPVLADEVRQIVFAQAKTGGS
jgi:hypothetical protein